MDIDLDACGMTRLSQPEQPFQEMAKKNATFSSTLDNQPILF